MLTEEEREKFVDKIKMQLILCNYGFQIENESYDMNGYTIDQAKNMRAIQELMIRLNIWKIRGKKDNGSISYPEAKRRIDYVLDENNISRCKVNLLRFK